MDEVALLELARDLARQAGQCILQSRAAGFEVQRKADHSLVTEADRAAEAVIVAGLRRASAIPVIAEEEVAAGLTVPRSAWYWLVDPLDGTREFAAGRDEFAVNIGLVREGCPVLGVVHGPATGTVHGGIVGRGAWREGPEGRRAPIAARAAPETGLAVVMSRHGRDDAELASYLATQRVARTEWLGSALKFCRVAEGSADLYARFGRTMEWDTAAPQALVEAAGGRLIDFASRLPLRYGKPNWENGAFLCLGAEGGRPLRL